MLFSAAAIYAVDITPPRCFAAYAIIDMPRLLRYVILMMPRFASLFTCHAFRRC